MPRALLTPCVLFCVHLAAGRQICRRASRRAGSSRRSSAARWYALPTPRTACTGAPASFLLDLCDLQLPWILGSTQCCRPAAGAARAHGAAVLALGAQLPTAAGPSTPPASSSLVRYSSFAVVARALVWLVGPVACGGRPRYACTGRFSIALCGPVAAAAAAARSPADRLAAAYDALRTGVAVRPRPPPARRGSPGFVAPAARAAKCAGQRRT